VAGCFYELSTADFRLIKERVAGGGDVAVLQSFGLSTKICAARMDVL
jgi:hypothetical protein